MVAGLDFAYPDAAKIGGLASASGPPRSWALFCWSAGKAKKWEPAHGVISGGCAGLVLHGGVTIEPVIAQVQNII